MPVFRYSPTLAPEWLVVAAPGCMLAVRLDLASPRIEQLVSLTRGGSTVQGLLDALTSGGLANTPSFVLAFWLPGRLTADGVGVVARGEGRAVVATSGGDVAVDAGGFASWTERHVDGATGVVFELGDAGADVVDLEIDGGSVWASRISLVEDEDADADEDEDATPALAAPAAPAENAPREDAAAGSGPREDTSVEATTTPGPEVVAGGGIAAEDTAHASDMDDDDPIEGHTIARPSRAVLAARAAADASSSAPPLPPAPPLPAPPLPPAPPSPVPVDTLGDHDGLTVLAEDLRAARQSGHLPATAKTPSFAVQCYELELPSGGRQLLDAPVLLGRAPSVAGVPASALPHLVTLAGDDISRNHVRVAVEGGTVVVTDLHSSNGTLVVIPGRAPEKLRGGEPTPVIGGTLIDLGGGVTVRVWEC